MTLTTTSSKTPSSASPEDNAASLGGIRLFAGLGPEIVARVRAITEFRSYNDGETIASAGQGDAAEFLLILSGAVNGSRLDAASGAMIFERHAQGDAIGLPAAMACAAALGEKTSDGATETPEIETETLIADGATRLAAVEAAGFWRLAQFEPRLALALARHFADALVQGRRAALASDAAPERAVYAALAGLAEPDGDAGAGRISRMPRHRELAARARVEEAVAARAVARLIEEGTARRDYPGLVLNDLALLRRLAR